MAPPVELSADELAEYERQQKILKKPYKWDKVCESCQRPYKAGCANQKYCGAQLRKEGCAYQVYRERTRKWISDHRELLNKRKRNPNPKSRQEWAKQTFKPAICRRCGNEYIPTNGRQKYCGSQGSKVGCSYRKFVDNVRWRDHHFRRPIRVKRIINGMFTMGQWDVLKALYGFACPMCQRAEPKIKLTIDHKIPVSKGGTNALDNIQPLCFNCNSKKKNRIWFASCPLTQNAIINPSYS